MTADGSVERAVAGSSPDALTAALEFKPTCCAICATAGPVDEYFPAHLPPDTFRPEIFSARRTPDGHQRYRMVRCRACGLVRADPVADASLLVRLYAASNITYGEEIPDLRITYARYLAQLTEFTQAKGTLLEVGCGSGFALETALDAGYAAVTGVEPSAAAKAQAHPRVRERIVTGMMTPGLFAPASFDVITLFQVLDHLPDPAAMLRECRRILKPGGYVLALNHDAAAWGARLLGTRWPTVVTEHLWLFSVRTESALFTRCGFRVRQAGAAVNRFSLGFLAGYIPWLPKLKSRLLPAFRQSRLGRVRISLPFGNLYLIAEAVD